MIATAKKFSCRAFQESQRRRLHAVVARVLHEPSTCLQVDQFVWKHLVLNLHVLGTIMVDAGSRAASVTLNRVMDTEHVTSEIMLSTQLNHSDPEGTFRDQECRRGSCSQEHPP